MLGYILDIVAKTNELEGKLERMADFCFWGEATARAMGCRPMEFLNVYSENLKNQSRDAVNFNALAEIICSICQEEFVTQQHLVEYTLSQLLTKVRETAFEMGIEVDKYRYKVCMGQNSTVILWEIMLLSSVIEDSYGYKIERYK